jgi:drug/metabolite transporter (DMT)-like permease
MTRGTLVLFVGLFSVLFLHRSLSATKWFSLVIVVLGVGIVGLSGMIEQKPGPPHLPGDTEPPALSSAQHALDLIRRSFAESDGSAASDSGRIILGMMLIFLAQTFTASQFVLEESIMHSSTVGPLQMVAFEGTFGLVLTLLLQVLLYATYGSTDSGRGGYFDMRAGWEDITGHRSIWVSSLLIMVCVGAFNFFGLSVTKNVSATSRSTIDTCRVLFVWLTSLGLGWEHFRWLQVLGFVVLVYGTFLYNEIVRMPNWKSVQGGSTEEERRDD